MKKSLSGSRFLYTFMFILGIFLIIPNLNAQVNREELENLGPVEFINYEGPYTRIETRAQIRSIGYSLGLIVKNNQNRAGTSGRYFVIHSVSPADGFKMDADIFGLGVDVGVDHIRNLRLIIQGYLEAAYNYTERDAALLAEYITIYNAVYRGDLNFYDSRYKSDVMSNITREKAGLSIRYDEWPGQTLMIIPLGMVNAGPLSSVDTGSLSDSRVTEQLRQESDMGLDTRKDMVDLMERQSDEAAQQAAIQREAIREEEARQAREQQQLQEQQRQAEQQRQQAQAEQQRIAQERQQADADQKALDQQQKEAQQKEQDAQEQQRQAEEKQKELDQQQQQLEQQKQDADQVQQYSDQKADEAQQGRSGIAEDQQSMINQENLQPAAADGVLGAMILSPNDSLGRVVKVSPDSGQELRRSNLNTVNARSLTLVNGKIIAIAGENRGNGAIRLVEINPDTLEMVKQGDDDISPQSLIWVNGNDLFAICSAGGNYYLARFNTDLARQARSSMTVHPFAAVTITNNYLITQRADGTAVLLNLGDLAEKR